MASKPQSPQIDSNPASPEPRSPGGTRPSGSRNLSSGHSSPHRHHHRTISATREIKETRNARSEYMNSEDDGASQRRINQYLIQQEIGRGSFGSVHLATDQFGTQYAVKEFSKHRLRRRAKSNLLRQTRQNNFKIGSTGIPSLAGASADSEQSRKEPPKISDDSSFDLIREEIAIMKKLNHGNLVSLIEVLDDPEEDSLYMVLEMCKKGVVMRVDIDQPVQPYDDENCRLWFRDLILGIEYLHAQGVVHRDIKPDNCLLTEDDTLKLVDFGVSEMFDKASDMKIAKSAGSPAFMAPELCIIQKEAVLGQPADIWSMGVTLFCLHFGRVPFQKSNMLDLYDAIVKEDLEIPSECGPELKDLLLRVLEKDPVKRIEMVELRNHPWVTKSGEDPLLSTEENCASPLEPPTEAEMNTAITGNMGGLIAVLKAANKFKEGLERHHPELVESILGRASQLTLPPLTMQHLYQRGSDIKGRISRHLTRSATIDSSSPSEHVVTGSGIYRQKDVDKEMGRLNQEFERTSMDPKSRAKTPRNTVPAPPHQVEDDFVPESFAGRRRHTYDETIKGHAHDVSKDVVFVNIGPGPTKDEDEVTEPDIPYVVSESPPQTEGSVFEMAYEKEVEAIEKSGRGSKIYLTRRVDPAEQKQSAKSRWGNVLGRSKAASPPASPPAEGLETDASSQPAAQESESQSEDPAEKHHSKRAALGAAFGRAMQSGGEKLSKLGSSLQQPEK